MGGLAVRCGAGLTSAPRADCVNVIFCTHLAQAIMVTCRFNSQVYKSFFFFFWLFLEELFVHPFIKNEALIVEKY